MMASFFIINVDTRSMQCLDKCSIVLVQYTLMFVMAQVLAARKWRRRPFCEEHSSMEKTDHGSIYLVVLLLK